MKAGILLLIMFSFHLSLSAGGDNRKNKTYIARVKFISGQAAVKGILSEASDTSVVIAMSGQNFHEEYGRPSLQEIHFSVMDEIRLNRTKNVTRGMIYGMLAGFTAGAILFDIAHKDSSGSDDPFAGIGQAVGGGAYGLSGMAAGGVIGAIAGMSLKVKIPVKGSHENFSSNKERLRRYSLKK